MTTAFSLMKRNAAVICCPSQQTLDDCVHFGVDPERLRLVPWGVETQPITDQQRSATRRRYGLPGRFVLSVGTIEPRKNLTRVIAAYRQAAPEGLGLVMVGPKGWNMEAFGPMPDGILQLGFVPESDLRTLYDLADALVMPSRREGFGLPALEAMAQGTAVIAAEHTAVAEILGGTGRLLPPDDTDAWADTLQELRGDPDWSVRQQTMIAQRVASFSWSSAAGLTAEIYADVAGITNADR